MGAVVLKRLVWFSLAAFTVLFVVTAPVVAAQVFKDAVGSAARFASLAGEALLTFLGSLID
jgi:hypothetical protein